MKKILILLWVFVCMFGITHAEPVNYPHLARENFNALNSYRATKGLTKLIWNDDLAQCIQDYLVLQNKFGTYGHTWPGWTTPSTRCKFANLWPIWENLIYSSPRFIWAAEALTLRQGSPSHNRNMLHPTYVYAGVAVIYDPVKQESRRWQVFAYWTQSITQDQSTQQDSVLNSNNFTWGTQSVIPKAYYRNVEKVSNVRHWEKKYLRLHVTLDYDVDRTKMREQLLTIVRTLQSTFQPM